MIYPIVKYGNPILDKPSEIVTIFDEELKQLVEDMFESMYAAHGVGLAAPQIGIPRRIAVIDCSFKEDPAAKMVIINPEIIKKHGKQTHSEGCLSLPDFRENVSRAMKCSVRAQDVTGKWFEAEGEELLARALQHETDHLSGTLYIDTLTGEARRQALRELRRIAPAPRGR